MPTEPLKRIPLTVELKRRLREAGVETLFNPGQVRYPNNIVFEPPCSLKWLRVESELVLGAFSYAVSGYCFACTIGRYTSIGEQVNIGRQDHPTSWLSTSPFQYLRQPLFNIGSKFEGGEEFHAYRSHLVGVVPGTVVKQTAIGNDVWIGHGAFVRAGITVGDGAIIAAESVVVKDVPPYAIVGGNPARVLRSCLPERLVERLLASRWWRFAPWQLGDIPFHDMTKAIGQIEEITNRAEPYEPGRRRIVELIDDSFSRAHQSHSRILRREVNHRSRTGKSRSVEEDLMPDETRVVFLHLPKTAGQSVHKSLVDLFGRACVCPARVNEDLVLLSVDEICRYRVLSGHFDWSMVDCIPHPKFVFTILREPLDRILSFYFFLREDASRLTEAELNQPWNAGRRAALRWSCDEYFVSKKPDFRSFINNFYDNLYTYYFAGRTFEGRQKLTAQQARLKSSHRENC